MADKIKEKQLEQAHEIETKSSWNCEEHKDISGKNSEEHIEQCLGEMLNSYIEDERNYIVNGAVIRCAQMSDKEVGIRFKRTESNIMLSGAGQEITSSYVKPEDIGPANDEFVYYLIPSHVGDKYIRKLYAVHGSSQSANGIPFATVIDRTSLREKRDNNGSKYNTCRRRKGSEHYWLRKLQDF